MKVAILDKKVRRNIALFKHLIEHLAEKRGRFTQMMDKTYRAYINRKTGELSFPDLEKKATFSEKDWTSIQIKLCPTEEEGAFEVVATDDETCFNCEELESTAYQLMTKTLHVLNQLSYDPKQRKNPLWILRNVTHLDFEMTEEEEGKKNLIREAWHPVDRIKAEYLLEGRPVGTYLFRKDEFADILEAKLNEDFSVPITCITMTYNDWDEKICEKTLVLKDDKWLFFNDDTELLGPFHSTVKELLETMGDQLRKPLYAD